jgi:predicted RNA binding protein YcfA (HicA-like mRNA interferase family)
VTPSEKLKPVGGHEVIRKLKKAGFLVVRTRGSAHILKHPTTGRETYVHIHRGQDIPTGTLRKIIQQAGLTIGEFNDL